MCEQNVHTNFFLWIHILNTNNVECHNLLYTTDTVTGEECDPYDVYTCFEPLAEIYVEEEGLNITLAHKKLQNLLYIIPTDPFRKFPEICR